MATWTSRLQTDTYAEITTELGEPIELAVTVAERGAQATCRIEYAPGFSPWVRPADGDWELLAAPYSYTRSRGRKDLFDQMDAGSATIEVPDRDGAIFAAGLQAAGTAGAIPALTPIRIVLTIAGYDYIRFDGYLLDPPIPSGKGRGRTATLRCVDWLGAMSSRKLPTSPWAAFVATYQPLLWWRDRATSSQLSPTVDDIIYNEGSDGTTGDAHTVGDQDNYLTYQITDQDLIADDNTNSWLVNRQVLTTSSLTWSSSYTVAMFFQASAAPASTTDLVWAASTPAGSTYRWRIRFNAFGSLLATVYNSSGTQVATGTVAVNHCDGNPHVVIMQVTPSAFAVYTDLGFATASPSGTPGDSGYVTVNRANGFGAATVLWSNLVIWDQAFTPNPSSQLLVPSCWLTGLFRNLWYNDSLLERVTNLIAAAGVPAPPLEAHTVEAISLGEVASGPGGDLASAVLDTAAGVLGTATMTRYGALRFRDYSFLDDEVDLQQMRVQIASLTDNPFGPDLDGAPKLYARLAGTFKAGARVAAPPQLPVVRYSPAEQAGARLDRVVNVARFTDPDGGVVTWIDRASVDACGELEKAVSVAVAAQTTWVRTAAKELVAARATPKPEIREITVTPTTIAEANFVIDADLEDPVHFHATDPTGTDVLIDGSFRIQAESESWAGTTWSASYTLVEA